MCVFKVLRKIECSVTHGPKMRCTFMDVAGALAACVHRVAGVFIPYFGHPFLSKPGFVDDITRRAVYGPGSEGISYGQKDLWRKNDTVPTGDMTAPYSSW